MMRVAALFLIRAYRALVSPLLGTRCRFCPSCSEYTYEAIARHGFLKGMVLGVRRLLRCHPFHEGGIDPVP
jgi:putative membrane protein insertion efficiency factor